MFGREKTRVMGSGVFRGGDLVRGPLWPTAVIFVTILGLFLAPFREKIAAASDQMRFFAGKCSKMPRTQQSQLGELTALPQRCQPVYC